LIINLDDITLLYYLTLVGSSWDLFKPTIDAWSTGIVWVDGMLTQLSHYGNPLKQVKFKKP